MGTTLIVEKSIFVLLMIWFVYAVVEKEMGWCKLFKKMFGNKEGDNLKDKTNG